MKDKITLSIPLKADYLLTARLAASSVASRMDFDVNDIEDIKTATSEAILLFIHQQSHQIINITFWVEEKLLTIGFSPSNNISHPKISTDDDNMLGRYMLEALTDSVTIMKEDHYVSFIELTKQLNGK